MWAGGLFQKELTWMYMMRGGDPVASFSQMILALEERVGKLEMEIKKIYELIQKKDEKEGPCSKQTKKG